MFRAILTSLFCATATPLFALSCAPADAVQSTLWAIEDDALRTVVLGRLTIPEQRPVLVGDLETGSYEYEAHLRGYGPSRHKFDRPIDRTVTVSVSCFDGGGGQGCERTSKADAYADTLDVLYFPHVLEDGSFVIRNDLCSPNAISAPTRRDLRRVLRCLRGGRCVPENQY